MRTSFTVFAAIVAFAASLTLHAQAGAPATRTVRGGVEAGAPATRTVRGGVEAGAPATRTVRGGVEAGAPATRIVRGGVEAGNHQGSGFTTIIGSAMRYAMSYEQNFALLAADETYVQELQRPPNPGDNLSQRNPGGGMRAGGEVSRLVIKSDFLLVQLGGDGEGWMPFRDAFEVKGARRRERDDRLLKLFQSGDDKRFEKAAKLSEETARLNLGNVARTINIPPLALMFLHPRVNERFEFTDEGEETIGGRVLRRAAYREAARPTLIKTTRGRDLALTGHIWIDPFTGTVIKTDLNAADPAVRCAITVTYRKDETLDFWVPSLMEEYYKAALGLDEILSTATYSNVRRFLKTPSDK